MEILSRTNILALYDKVVSEDRRTDHLPDSHTVGLGPIARRGAPAAVAAGLVPGFCDPRLRDFSPEILGKFPGGLLSETLWGCPCRGGGVFVLPGGYRPHWQ
jgi:hypothetical protein